ncbi:catalase family protein [Sphingomonas ginsenosidivorax]|uniref:Catalase family protein n=1 Tax=Sphingomonas ginsenosidivorax TaxID=862135 RepID=A0A5C6UDX8_9SPHN|nr:catalase family protein [Sphingomonas ginsenosidivorax]TXC70316.1 catalase family protein [Sphingomonas ginsenosidivorax]
MAYLPYRDDIETLEPGEQESIDGIIQGMTQESQTVEKRDGHAVRASHAKSTACVVGELTVADDLPPELAQGLFATPGTFAVAVRFAQGPGEKLGDRVSTHRGMAIKIFGVEGEALAGHDAPTQDFVLASGTTFPAGTAAGFLSQAKKIGMTVPMPEAVKSAAASVARNINAVLNAVAGSPSPTLDFYGHPFSHPLDECYFSQCPIRFGDYVAKLGAFPVAAEQRALDGWTLDPHQDEDGFRHAAIAYFDGNDAVFELRAQLWANADTQPIEDTSVDWPTEDSAYRTIATIRLPRQDAYSAARVRYFDEVMTFRPAHSLAAHRPLGGVMRARLQVYRALSDFRHRETGIAAANTASVDDIPA